MPVSETNSAVSNTGSTPLRRASHRAALLSFVLTAGLAHAQTCLTQAKMPADMRSSLAAAGTSLGEEVKAGDVTKLQGAAIVDYAANFSAAGVLIRDTAAKLSGDALEVTHVYELDATGRKPSDTSDADFSCALTGTAAETDFSISGLPPGRYGFVMVEAMGDRPWLLSFLVRQEDGQWKLAGFYSHARSAAGHDGVWYWTAARKDATAKDLWSAWLMYGQADALLKPSGFASSSNLDRLRAEQRAANPPELAEGIGPATPLVVKGTGGAEFRFTGIASQGSDDGRRLELVLHLQAEPGAQAATNTAAAKAFLLAHPELRRYFADVLVLADIAGQQPLVTQQKLSELN